MIHSYECWPSRVYIRLLNLSNPVSSMSPATACLQCCQLWVLAWDYTPAAIVSLSLSLLPKGAAKTLKKSVCSDTYTPWHQICNVAVERKRWLALVCMACLYNCFFLFFPGLKALCDSMTVECVYLIVNPGRVCMHHICVIYQSYLVIHKSRSAPCLLLRVIAHIYDLKLHVYIV